MQNFLQIDSNLWNHIGRANFLIGWHVLHQLFNKLFNENIYESLTNNLKNSNIIQNINDFDLIWLDSMDYHHSKQFGHFESLNYYNDFVFPCLDAIFEHFRCDFEFDLGMNCWSLDRKWIQIGSKVENELFGMDCICLNYCFFLKNILSLVGFVQSFIDFYYRKLFFV